MKEITARHAIGQVVRGMAMVANDGFSARYDLNRVYGIFSRQSHKLSGQSYVGKILILDTAKGGIASAWMLHEMASRQKIPLAIVFNIVNLTLAQGAAFGRVPCWQGLTKTSLHEWPMARWWRLILVANCCVCCSSCVCVKGAARELHELAAISRYDCLNRFSRFITGRRTDYQSAGLSGEVSAQQCMTLTDSMTCPQSPYQSKFQKS